MTERTLTAEQQQIEYEAIASFVDKAATMTAEQRKTVASKMARFARPESEYGERPVFNGHKMSVAGVIEALRQMEAL